MKRSKHSLSHYKLLTCKMGSLVPVAWYEALPGDTIQQSTSALIRCAPLVTPVMHPITVRFHHWFVPNRLIWANWQNFITGGSDGLDATAHPYITFTNPAVSTLADYLGVPTANFSSKRVSALPFRAYNLIFNEYYRDEDLVTALTTSTGDGSDTTSNTTLQTIAWEKDYLTSSRPWAVKGAAITLPLGTQAWVRGLAQISGGGATTAGPTAVFEHGDTVSRNYSNYWTGGSGLAIQGQTSGQPGASNTPQVYADLSTATGIDINTVRNAFALQRFEEARARYGSRYTEYLRYLGVRSSDARLQRPEYLGGGKNIIQFSEVLQTGVTTSGTQTGIGTMFGHGITGMRTNRYRRFFEEHGIVITLMSVRPKTMYSQRVKRAFIRGVDSTYVGTTANKYDYWQRELQTIGQQQVNAAEVDPQAGVGSFGYQDRYDEYRREESSVAGLFRTTLNTWHLSREFGSAPSLNSTFVQCVPSTRIFADTSNDNLYVCANHSIQARRLVSREGKSLTF
jgi:Capsid protein (F protein)